MFAKDKICSAGLIYFYIAGVEQGNEFMLIDVIESGNFLPDAFYINATEASALFDNFTNGVELFGIIGSKKRITSIKDVVKTEIKNNYYRNLKSEEIITYSSTLDEYGNSFFKLVQEYFCECTDGIPYEYELEAEGWNLYCIYKSGEKNSHHIENALSIWLDMEKSTIIGKQLVLQSFLFRDLIGRRVVGNIPDYRDGSWNVVFEGGVKLPTGANHNFIGDKVNFDEIHGFSISQLDAMINNPGYAYGKVFLPTALCLQWYKVFFVCMCHFI